MFLSFRSGREIVFSVLSEYSNILDDNKSVEDVSKASLKRDLLDHPRFQDFHDGPWDNFEFVQHKLHGHYTIKLEPKFQGLRVVGAEMALALNSETGRWKMARRSKHSTGKGRRLRKRLAEYSDIDTSFVLSKRGAIERAFGRVKDSRSVYAERVWFVPPHSDNDVVPAWSLFNPNDPPTQRELLFLDGRDGSVIHTIPTVRFDQGYVYPAVSNPAFGSRPPLATLLDVNPTISTNGGFSIRGKDFKSFNSCFAYKCSPESGITNGTCGTDDSICVDAKPGLVKGQDYFTTGENMTLDGRYIDYDKNWTADGFANGRIHMRWEAGMVFAPRLKKPDSGLWGSDIDFVTYSTGDQRDAFAELQAYSLFTEHLKFLRNLLNDTTFCLLGTGPNCSVMDPKTNRTATKYDYPLGFTVNIQRNQMDLDVLFDGLGKGLGKSSSNPIVFTEFSDYEDAYFAWSPYQPPVNGSLFPDCYDGRCVSISASPLNFIVFGQNKKFDWALNQCTVFHELNHVLVQKYIPYLPSYAWTSHGLSSEPGALNEGWADYFAAIHCGISDFRQTYNGRPRRTLDNTATCADYVGEVHAGTAFISIS